MACDFPCIPIPYVTLYILSFCIIQSNSRTSTHWKVDSQEGKVVQVSEGAGVDSHFSSGGLGMKSLLSNPDTYEDAIMSILAASGVGLGTRRWTKSSHNSFCLDCAKIKPKDHKFSLKDATAPKTAFNDSGGKKKTVRSKEEDDDEILDCGKAANFTFYDHLVGIANRNNHPHIPEPQVALVFKKKNSKKPEVDLDALERKLRKAKREKPRSVQLYNQIGNFWRIKGDTQKSIECFRRALSVSPNNAEVLLNLARVLLNLQYLDDAIFLTRRSLEVQSPDKNNWQQHFTLGEILKAYGHYQEAALHLRHTLELKPDFQPALAALRDMEALPDKTIHKYTLLIIVFLVLGVLLVILSSLDGGVEEYPEIKTQRHFNRAMAMRSIKMGISPRALRTKRYSSNC